MPLCSGILCTSTVRLDGKTALITGCNTGIGKVTVADFYQRGARVIMACRSVDKAQEAKTQIEEECKDVAGCGQIVVVKCDLASLKSVKECATHVLDTEPQMNILVNNAGVMMCPQGVTEDGFEMQMGTNHLAHFLLTLLLLPRIRNSTPARIVTVSSVLHSRYHLDLDDLNFEKRPYEALKAYCQSKLANVMFSRELAKKLEEFNIDGINTYSLHPGVVITEINRHWDDTMFSGARGILRAIMKPFMKSVVEGTQTTIYCAVDEKCANETGLYYSDCVVTKPAKMALNDENSEKLWNVSNEMVGLNDFNPFTVNDAGVKTSD